MSFVRRVIELNVRDVVHKKNWSRAMMNEEALKELTDSISKYGLLQPPGVVPTRDGKWELVYGGRRHASVIKLGVPRASYIVVSDNPNLTETEKASYNIDENAKRSDPPTLDQGKVYFRMMEDNNWTVAELSQHLQIKKSRIQNVIGVMSLIDKKYIDLAVDTNPQNTANVDGVITVAKLTAIVALERRYGLAKERLRELCEACRIEGIDIKGLQFIARGWRTDAQTNQLVQDYLHDSDVFDSVSMHFRVRRSTLQRFRKKHGRFLNRTLVKALRDYDKNPEAEEVLCAIRTLICPRG